MATKKEQAKDYATKGWNDSGVTDDSELTFKGTALIQMAEQDFITDYNAAQQQCGNVCQCSLLREAATELLHLHMAEQEGMLSGKPTAVQWLASVNKLSNILYPPEGE